MRRIAVRIPDEMWRAVREHARELGLVQLNGATDISSTVRDLVRRGLRRDESRKAGYASGFAEGHASGYSAFQRELARAKEPSS